MDWGLVSSCLEQENKSIVEKTWNVCWKVFEGCLILDVSVGNIYYIPVSTTDRVCCLGQHVSAHLH
jgi:hypothetical protein